MKVGDTIYFKLFRVDMLEIVKGTVIGLHNDYVWAVTDSEDDLPRTLMPSDIQNEEGYKLWQLFYKTKEDIQALKNKEEEIYKELRKFKAHREGGFLK